MDAPVFERTRLSFARNLEGMNKSDLARHAGVSPAAVTQWESGVKTPSSENVKRITQILNVPPTFFTPGEHGDPVTPQTMHYTSNTAGGILELERQEAMAYVKAIQYIDATLRTYVDFPARNLPDIPADPEVKDSTIPELAAELVRKAWNVPTNEPIPHLARLAENNGVYIIWSSERAAGYVPYSVDTGSFPLVVLNSWSADYYRQRVELARQLGHLVMHADAEPRNRIYRDQAERFADDLLLPAEPFETEFPKRFTQDGWMRLFEMKEKWGVPVQQVLSCAHRRGLMKTRRYHEQLQKLSAYGWKVREPGRSPAVEDVSLFPAAVRLISEQRCASVEELLEQSRVPWWCFEFITSRVLQVRPSAG